MLVCLYGTIHESPQRCNAYGPPHQNEEKGFDMTAKNLPPVEELRKLLRYVPETGKLYWRKRGNPQFDAQRAGKEAFISQRKGYKRGEIGGVTLSAHTVAWAIHYGTPPASDLDHINHCRSDNRIENLRLASLEINAKNRSKSKTNTSGVTGVSWHKSTGKWCAYIGVNGKPKNLGRFHRKEDAIKARLEAEIRYGFHMNHGR